MSGRVVIVGAGHAGVQLADSLREEKYHGEIVIVGDETEDPYQRPPLTKDFLNDHGLADLLPLRGAAFYGERGIDLRIGRRVQHIDRGAREVQLDDGSALDYENLVIATGARPRHLESAPADSSALHSIRRAEDARRFGRDLKAARSLAIVGAGYVGLEVAAATRARGVDVTIVTSTAPLSRVASRPLSAFLGESHSAQGSRFVYDDVVRIDADRRGAGAAVVCAKTGAIHADMVLVAIGAVASADLAVDAGIAVSNGIVVDEYARTTSDPHVWAIGDVAERLTPAGPVREESVQAATHQARCLALTLIGRPTVCSEVPWFWSTQGDLKLQIAGLPRPSARAIVRGETSTGKFSVFTYDDDRLLAVESVNSVGDHLAARRILASGRGLSPERAADPAFDLKAYSREAAETTA